MLLLRGVILLANFVFNWFSGFRRESTGVDAIFESLTAVGLGLVHSLGLLYLIGEVVFQASGPDILGRVLIEAVPVSL